jgi:hypothetical protein
VPAGWPERPRGYLLFGPPYDDAWTRGRPVAPCPARTYDRWSIRSARHVV